MANPTMIVAEDDEIIREVLSCQLGEKGYDVRSAADGAKAWELFRQQACEILVTDLEMPRMNGQNLIAKVKEHSPATVVIVLTGHGSLESARNLIDMGCNEYILKPIKDINEFDVVIKRSLEHNRLIEQAIFFKRLNTVQSGLLHKLTYDLVEPTFTLLNSIDRLIGTIKEGDVGKSLTLAQDIKQKASDLTMVVGKLGESSNQLDAMKGLGSVDFL